MVKNAYMTPDTGALGVPGDLGRHLGMILRGYRTRFEEAVANLPAGIRGYQILSTVVHHDPSNQQALGAHLAIDRTVLTYLLDTLVAAGLVERVPDPGDRRVRKVVATSDGTRLLAHFEERVAAIEGDLLSGLSEAETQFLVALIRRLSMEIHRTQPGINPCDAMDR